MSRLNKIQTTLLVLGIMVVTIPLSAYAVDGQRKISQTPSTTFPITISQPGSYVLTSNLVVTDPNVNAIEITVNDVTFDLNGHMIQGPHTGAPWGGSGKGIYALDRYNITIKNGRIWGFGGIGVNLSSTQGIASEKGAGHEVDRIQVANNGEGGIRIYAGLVTNCTTNNNGNSFNENGIDAYNSTIINCTANNNGDSGINAENSTIINCTANNNGDSGIHTDYSVITNSTANANAHGFQIHMSTITNCFARMNTEVGFISSGGCTVTNCSATDNVKEGFSAAVQTTLTNCTSTFNGGHGILATKETRIEGNNLRYNGQDGTGYGIFLNSDHNYVLKNSASDNENGNFYDVQSGTPGANYMPICGVDATDNCNYGF